MTIFATCLCKRHKTYLLYSLSFTTTRRSKCTLRSCPVWAQTHGVRNAVHTQQYQMTPKPPACEYRRLLFRFTRSLRQPPLWAQRCQAPLRPLWYYPLQATMIVPFLLLLILILVPVGPHSTPHIPMWNLSRTYLINQIGIIVGTFFSQPVD